MMIRYVTSILLLLFFAGFSPAWSQNDTPITNVTVNGLSFCEEQPVSVSYSISKTGVKFDKSNIFTAQLSNASGSFSSPVILGTLKSRQSGVINAIIPAGTEYGTHYRIRITSSRPVFTSNPNGTDLTLNSLPASPVAGTISQPTCVTTGSVVLSGLPATGTWTLITTPGGTTTSGTGTSTTVTDLASGIFTFTVMNTSGCISSASGNVVINAAPGSPSPPIAGSVSQPTCSVSTGSVVLNGLPATGTWTLTRTPGGTTTIGTGKSYTITELPAGTYSYIVTNASGCISAASTNIVINQPPAAPAVDAGHGGNNCGLEFFLGATPGTGRGTWTLVNGPGSATFSPDANTPDAKVTVTAYGTYTFRWSEVNGVCSNSATVSIIFYQQSSANAGNGGDECDKDFILKAVPGAVPGIWTKVSGSGNAVFSPGPNQADAKVTVSEFGLYDFAWTVTNSLCTSTDIIRVGFHDLPSVNAGADAVICEGGSIQLNATGAGSFQWNPANLVNNQTISNPKATPVATTVLTVTLTDQWGCKNSDQVSIEVRDQPIANAGPDQVLEYMFETTLDAAVLGNGQTGEWTIISGTGELADKNDNATLVSGLSPDINSYKWTITNGVCLMSSDTVNITVHDLIIPTLITPNKDGRNEYFTINGVETLGKTELVIFNKWGARVFINSDYDNKWDGTDENEEPLPDDTYFYVLRPEKSKLVRGYIVVKR